MHAALVSSFFLLFCCIWSSLDLRDSNGVGGFQDAREPIFSDVWKGPFDTSWSKPWLFISKECCAGVLLWAQSYRVAGIMIWMNRYFSMIWSALESLQLPESISPNWDTELVVSKEPGSDRVKEKNVGLQVGGSGVQSQLTTYLCPPDWGSFYSLALWEIWNRIFLRNLEPSQFVIYDFSSSGGREKRGSGKGRRETRLGRISTERDSIYIYQAFSHFSVPPGQGLSPKARQCTVSERGSEVRQTQV